MAYVDELTAIVNRLGAEVPGESRTYGKLLQLIADNISAGGGGGGGSTTTTIKAGEVVISPVFDDEYNMTALDLTSVDLTNEICTQLYQQLQKADNYDCRLVLDVVFDLSAIGMSTLNYGKAVLNCAAISYQNSINENSEFNFTGDIGNTPNAACKVDLCIGAHENAGSVTTRSGYIVYYQMTAEGTQISDVINATFNYH